MDYLKQIGLMVAAAVVGWFGSNVKSRRDKKQTDLQIINEAITPLLQSIKDLTDHNHGLTEKLLAEQTKNLAMLEERRSLLDERDNLADQVEKLNKRVALLERAIRKLAKDGVVLPPELDLKQD